MGQRTAFIIALVLTTFMLVIVAGLIGRMAIAPAADGSAQQPATAATTEPSVQGISAQREAEYQRALQTAQARIERANAQLQDAYRQLTARPADASATALPSPSPAAQPSIDQPPPPEPEQISPEQASAAALAYVGGGTVERVELEQEHGQLVYEVRFIDDSRVYLDPATGRVLYARLENRNARGGNRGKGGGDD
jgi:uncharacterized membrane protein YkoI